MISENEHEVYVEIWSQAPHGLVETTRTWDELPDLHRAFGYLVAAIWLVPALVRRVGPMRLCLMGGCGVWTNALGNVCPVCGEHGSLVRA